MGIGQYTDNDDIIIKDGNGVSITAANPLRIDPTGTTTQPISGTVTATGTVAVTQATSPWVTSRNWTLASGTDSISAVQSGTWNITNISGTISLPTGAATESTLSTLNGKIPSGLTVTSTRLLVDGSGVTQPVSGTVTANQGGTWNINNVSGTISLPTGAATSALQTTGNTSLSTIATTLTLAQGSTTSGQTGSLTLGAVTTAAPSYTTAQSSPLSLTTTGALRTDSSGTTQPISGTVTANQGGAPWSQNITQVGGASITLGQKPMSSSVPVVIASDQIGIAVKLSDATGNNVILGQKAMASSLPIVIASDQSSIPVTQSGTWTTGRTWTLASGTDSVAAVQSGTWNINNISGTISLPTGAATEATLAKLTQTQGSTTSGQSGPLIQGAVTTAAPSYSNAQTSPISLTTAGSLRVDGSAVTQPVSGTVTANQGGTWNINNISGTVSLPTGAATAANQSTEITSLQLIDNIVHTQNSALVSGVPIMGQLDDTSTTAAVEDDVAVARITAQRALHVNLRDALGNEEKGQKTSANSIPVVISSDQSTLPVTATPSDGSKTTYSATFTNLVTALLATDIFTISGSATKTVRILEIGMSATAAADTKVNTLLIKRSAANTAGTSTTATLVPHDSNNAAATVTVRGYTANPSALGAAVGTIRSVKFDAIGTSTVTPVVQIYDFGTRPGQAVVLRGAAEFLCLNLSGTTITTPSFNIWIEWSEE